MLRDRLSIGHELQYDEKGHPFLLRVKKPVIVYIEHHYMDGRVRTKSGDVWRVKRVINPEYEYVTTGVL